MENNSDNDGNQNEYVRIDDFSISYNGSDIYEYPITLNSSLTDLSEKLSDITLTNLPAGTSLKDSGGNTIAPNADGSYTVVTDDTVGDATVTLVSPTSLTAAETGTITASVESIANSGDIAKTTLGGSGDDLIAFEAGDSVDGGAGNDTLTFGGAINLDFSDANMANISNIEKIDLSAGDHEITLSLSDVLDMTDPAHNLVITGDTNDTLHFTNDLAGSGWAQTNDGAESNGDGTATYSYSDGSDTLTLTVDENIQNTGL